MSVSPSYARGRQTPTGPASGAPPSAVGAPSPPVPPFIIVYPVDGSYKAFQAGEILFDLQEGLVNGAGVQNDPLSSSLSALNLKYMQSVTMRADVSFSARIEGPDMPGASFYLDYQHEILSGFKIQKLHLYSALPRSLALVFGSEVNPPLTPYSEISPVLRYATAVATTNSMTGVTMSPLSFNPLSPNVASALSSAAASTAPAVLSAAVIETTFMKTKTFLVQNSSANGVNLNIQGALLPIESYFVDDPSTGSSLVLPGNTNANLQVSEHYAYTRLRVQSNVSGNAGTLNVYFSGLLGV